MPAPCPPELRARVVQRVQEVGVRAAATECGVSPAAASKWALAAGVENVHSERTRKRIEANAAKWEERRLELVHKMGQVAAKALAKSDESLEHGKVRDAQSAAVTMAILVDKAQLLSGGATSRTETRTALDAELERLADKVAGAPETADA